MDMIILICGKSILILWLLYLAMESLKEVILSLIWYGKLAACFFDYQRYRQEFKQWRQANRQQ